MNRLEAALALRSIREHVEIAETFLDGPEFTGRQLQLELLGRANQIEAKLARLRAAAMEKDQPEVRA